MRTTLFIAILLLCSCGKPPSNVLNLADCLKAANARKAMVIQMEAECAAIYHPENVPL